MNQPAAKPRRSRNREATEQALLDACGKLLLRDGPDGIGVNNVVAEAGVGKDLIYRYFNGLPGLIKAWAERTEVWPDSAELVGDADAFSGLPLKQQIQHIFRNYLQALRSRPVLMRILASELMQATEITSIFEDVSDRIGRELEVSVRGLDEAAKEDIVAISMVFYTMLNYTCIRAVTSPRMYGMDLREEDSWERIQNVMDDVIDRFLHE
jgi:AcrR family transcriptional regulator